MAEDIAYQSKDIIFKILSEKYKNKALGVYGLELSRIKEMLPTVLPVVKVDEKRSDNIFLLEDNSLLIKEYESSADVKNLIKYGHYAFRVAEKYYEDKPQKVTIVVIYTGDIQKAADSIDLGCMQLKVQQVFLSKYDSEAMYEELKQKIQSGERLSEEDEMRFIIMPLTAKDEKQELIEKSVSLAKEIDDEESQSFIIAGILTATDRFINKDYSNKIKEWLRMTQVGRLFEEEKIEYAKEYAKEYAEEKVNEKLSERNQEFAKSLLESDVDIKIIMKSTGLKKAEILKIKKSLSETQA